MLVIKKTANGHGLELSKEPVCMIIALRADYLREVSQSWRSGKLLLSGTNSAMANIGKCSFKTKMTDFCLTSCSFAVS